VKIHSLFDLKGRILLHTSVFSYNAPAASSPKAVPERKSQLHPPVCGENGEISRSIVYIIKVCDGGVEYAIALCTIILHMYHHDLLKHLSRVQPSLQDHLRFPTEYRPSLTHSHTLPSTRVCGLPNTCQLRASGPEWPCGRRKHAMCAPRRPCSGTPSKVRRKPAFPRIPFQM